MRKPLFPGARATLLACAVVAFAPNLQAQEFIVAVDGDDGRDGTSAATAVRTIQHAADLAQAGDTVSIRAGVYRETVRPQRSGRADAPIIFQAYRDETPVISGADPLTGWEPVPGRADEWQAPMEAGFLPSAINQADQVFRDGVMVGEARWPAAGPDISYPIKATITRFISKTRAGHVTTVVFEDDRLEPARDGHYVGASICMQPNAAGWGWTLSGTITAQHGHQLTMTTPNDAGEDGHGERYAVGARYHLFGQAAMISQDGDWHHDRAAGVLRIKSLRDPRRTKLEAKRRDYAFDLSERSWITVRKLTLFACSITSDAQAGGDGRPVEADGSPRFPWRPQGFVAPAHHLRLEDLHATYLNHFTDLRGHFFLQWTHQTGLVLAGSDHEIRGCTIRFSAGNGISLQGRRHRCIGNTIADTDYTSVDCAPISCGVQTQSEDFEIGWNTITRCARTGITLRGLHNSDPTKLVTRIHHNEVVDFLCQDWDGGAFYTFGNDGRFTRIDHNHFYCTKPRLGMVFGAYWDFSKNYVLDHNVIWGVPIPIQITQSYDNDGAKINNMLIYRNTAITNDAAWGYPLGGSPYGNGSIIQDNLFKVCAFVKPGGGVENGWPNYGDGKVVVRGNLLYGDHPVAYWTKEKRLLSTDRWTADPGLIPPAKAGDFLLTAMSPARGSGTTFATIERDGIQVPAFEDEPTATLHVGALADKPFAVGAAAAPH